MNSIFVEERKNWERRKMITIDVMLSEWEEAETISLVTLREKLLFRAEKKIKRRVWGIKSISRKQ